MAYCPSCGSLLTAGVKFCSTVKQALVTRYHVDPERLSSTGFGSTRPVASNDTLEGRARNRRVELVRE